MSVNEHLARHLRFERRAHELSVADLAELSGLTVAQLTNIERNCHVRGRVLVREGKQVTVSELVLLAGAMELDAADLLRKAVKDWSDRLDQLARAAR